MSASKQNPSGTLRLVSAALSGRRMSGDYVEAASAVLVDDDKTVRRSLRMTTTANGTSEPVKLPKLLAEIVELEFEEMYRADHYDVDDGCVFIIPPWWFDTQCRVEIQLDGRGHITKLGAHGACRKGCCPKMATEEWLMEPPPTMRDARLERAKRWAVRSLANLALVTGRPPSETSTWLLKAADDPSEQCAAAAEVWRKMLGAIGVPPALRKGWLLKLGDVPHILGTPERRVFATHWPWAAHALARTSPAMRRSCLRRLDSNIAHSVDVASRLLCCRGGRCSKTTALARKLPTIAPAVQQLVLGTGADPHRGYASMLRAALFEAEGENEAPLADRIVRTDPLVVQSQLHSALEVGMALDSPTSQLAVAGLVAWMLIGTEASLGVSSVVVGQALHKAATDSVAVFAAEHPPFGDPVDAGILALTRFFRRHRLTAPQFSRWAATVAPPDGRSFEGERSGTWPSPPGWNAAGTGLDGTVVPLSSIAAIVEEGEKMENCLAHGHYHDRAAAGEVHLFSMRSPQRSTLALREQRDESGTAVVNYEVVELKARRNRAPTAEAQQRALELVATLRRGLNGGVEIGSEELGRRQKSTRSFIAAPDVAMRLWKALASSLPARLHGFSPRRIAEEGAPFSMRCAPRLDQIVVLLPRIAADGTALDLDMLDVPRLHYRRPRPPAP